MYRLQMLVGVIIVAAAFNAHSMRCGTHLINEGDSASRAIQLCGTPNFDNMSIIQYNNKDGDGMNYTLHINGAGMIDSITFSRGGN